MTSTPHFPLISVIIPMYNSSKTITDSIKSVQKQNFADLEIVVINDGSTDDSLDIVKKLQLDDLRIVIVHKPQNEGIMRARQSGIEAAKGEYIQFLDSDDTMCVAVLDTLYNKAKAENADIVTAPFNIIAHGTQAECPFQPYQSGDNRIQFLKDLLLRKMNWSLCAKFHRRDLYSFKPFEWSNLSMGEDAMMTTQLICRAKTIASIMSPIFTYNLHDNSATLQYSSFTKQKLDDFLSLNTWLNLFLAKEGMANLIEKELAYYNLWTFVTVLEFHQLYEFEKLIPKLKHCLHNYPPLWKKLTKPETIVIKHYLTWKWLGRWKAKTYIKRGLI